MILERIMNAKSKVTEIKIIDNKQLKTEFGEQEESMIECNYIDGTISYDDDFESFLYRNNIKVDIDESLAVIYLEEDNKKYIAGLVIKTNRHDYTLGSEIFVCIDELMEMA